MTGNKFFTRRGFLKGSLMAASAAAFPTIIPACARGRDGHVAPSEKIVVGQIGVGDRGSYILGETLQVPGVQVVALCDVKKNRLDAALKVVNDYYSNLDCAAYGLHEELVARKDIDAVVVASCDHWHVLHALAAVRAGKGVYVEKPLGLTLEQDQTLRKAVNKHGGAFQFGTQQRSDKKFHQACELVRNGCVGKLKEIHVWSPGSVAGGPTEKAPVPPTLNYDRWLGAAPAVPYTLERDSNKWWWHISDYAIGFIAGWGIHPVDIALWGAGDLMRTPCTIEGTGVYPTTGVCNCATAWNLECAYDSGLAVHYRSEPAPAEWLKRFDSESGHGTAFVGDQGWVHVNRSVITASSKSLLNTKLPESAVRLVESRHHIRNFVDAVRTGAPTVSPVEAAVEGDLFCMACDVALRLQKKLRWDPVKEQFIGAPEANQRLTRPMRAPWNLG